MTSSASAPVFVAVGGRRFDRHQAMIALVIIAGMTFMITYVETMVIPAFETFYTFFDHPSDTTIAWILSAYLLVGTIATPVFGKLGDIYGKKKMMLVAFATGSFQGNPMYTVAGFQVSYVLLAGMAVFALVVGLALRNYRPGATAPSGANAEPLTSAAAPAT